MEEKDEPFRPFYLAITIIVVLACLAGLFFQIPDRFLEWLTGVGICFGIVLLVIIAVIISELVNEKINKIDQAKEPERLKQHQARFYCHICGKPSPKPDQYWDGYGENGQQYSSFFVTDYNKPTELVQCAKCQKWTCPNADPPHMENGICKKCLENTPEQA